MRNHDRTATLSKLNDLRPDRFDYFNHELRIDATRSAIPDRMMRYTFASSLEPDLLDMFLRFEFEDMDWFKAPHGLNGYLQALQSRAAPAFTDPRDYFAVPEQMIELGKFGQKLFTALGCTVGDVAQGKDFNMLCEFYAEHLKCSWKCVNQEDQLKWIENSATSFKGALAAIGASIRQRVYSANPGTATLPRALLSNSAEQIQVCLRQQSSMETLAEFRAQYGSLGESTGTALGNTHLPLPSERHRDRSTFKPSKPKKPSSESTEGASGRSKMKIEPLGGSEEDKAAAKPGSQANRHRWGNGKSLLYISGQVWNVKGIADKFKLDVNAYCWPYLLASCAERNRASRCDKWGQAGHKSDKDRAHVLPREVSPASLKEFARPASVPEREAAAATKDASRTSRKQRGKAGAKRAKLHGGSQGAIALEFVADDDGDKCVGEEEALPLTSATGGQPSNGQPALS